VAVGLGTVNVAASATIPGTLTFAGHPPLPAMGGADDLLRFLLARRERARQADWRRRLAPIRPLPCESQRPRSASPPLRPLGGAPRSRAIPAYASLEIPPQHPVQPHD